MSGLCRARNPPRIRNWLARRAVLHKCNTHAACPHRGASKSLQRRLPRVCQVRPWLTTPSLVVTNLCLLIDFSSSCWFSAEQQKQSPHHSSGTVKLEANGATSHRGVGSSSGDGAVEHSILPRGGAMQCSLPHAHAFAQATRLQ
jgi:hypothetical protein